MLTKGRRKLRNAVIAGSLASPLRRDTVGDYTFAGSIDQQLRNGTGGGLPYIADSDTRTIFDPMQRRAPRPRAPIPRPNPTIAGSALSDPDLERKILGIIEAVRANIAARPKPRANPRRK